ncbi:MAG: hypothetical protein JKP92_06930 [Alphaproteobacteria bacterium]|jgi:hypothetical protein|nr:hypothetical protein [Alphaproteobacteria bacterium]
MPPVMPPSDAPSTALPPDPEALAAARALLEPIVPRVAALPPEARQRFAIYLHCLAEACGADS